MKNVNLFKRFKFLTIVLALILCMIIASPILVFASAQEANVTGVVIEKVQLDENTVRTTITKTSDMPYTRTTVNLTDEDLSIIDENKLDPTLYATSKKIFTQAQTFAVSEDNWSSQTDFAEEDITIYTNVYYVGDTDKGHRILRMESKVDVNFSIYSNRTCLLMVYDDTLNNYSSGVVSGEQRYTYVTQEWQIFTGTKITEEAVVNELQPVIKLGGHCVQFEASFPGQTSTSTAFYNFLKYAADSEVSGIYTMLMDNDEDIANVQTVFLHNDSLSLLPGVSIGISVFHFSLNISGFDNDDICYAAPLTMEF